MFFPILFLNGISLLRHTISGSEGLPWLLRSSRSWEYDPLRRGVGLDGVDGEALLDDVAD